MDSRIGGRGGDQVLAAPHVALQKPRHRVRLFSAGGGSTSGGEVGEDIRNGAFLRAGRGEGDGREKFFRKRRALANRERRKRIVLLPLAGACDLYRKYLLEREAFACRFGVPQVVRF